MSQKLTVPGEAFTSPVRPKLSSPVTFQHWEALDGLRGVAALTVLLSHANGIGIMMLGLPDFSGTGKAGVVLFFLLSSFLLGSQFVKKGARAFQRSALEDYAFRRFIRIYPLYLVYLLTALVFTALSPLLGANETLKLPFELDTTGLFRQLLLLQGKGVTWSIVVEFKFYFVLPLLMIGLSQVARCGWLVLSLVAAALVALLQWLWPQGASVTNDIRLGVYGGIFLLGALLAMAAHRWQQSRPAGDRGLTIDIAGVCALFLALALIPANLAAWTGRDIPSSIFDKRYLETCLLFCPVLFAAVCAKGIVYRIFSWRPLCYLGKISFSLYLWHIVVIRVFSAYLHKFPQFFENWFLQSIWNGWLLLAVCIAGSTISYRLIERPLLSKRLDDLLCRNSVKLPAISANSK